MPDNTQTTEQNKIIPPRKLITLIKSWVSATFVKISDYEETEIEINDGTSSTTYTVLTKKTN